MMPRTQALYTSLMDDLLAKMSRRRQFLHSLGSRDSSTFTWVDWQLAPTFRRDLMQRDIRESALYREAEQFYESVRRPGTGQLSDAADLHVSPDGRRAVFAGNFFEKLAGPPPGRICLIDLTSAETRVLTFGPNIDRLPK